VANGFYQGKTYTTWAEFGGTLVSQGGENVLLRDKWEQEIIVPLRMLNPGLDEKLRYPSEPTTEADKKWLKKRRNVISAISYPNNLKRYQNWKDFAGYVH